MRLGLSDVRLGLSDGRLGLSAAGTVMGDWVSVQQQVQ